MNRALLIAVVSSISTQAMDLADFTVTQHELHNQATASTQLTPPDHHKELAQLIRSSDLDGLRAYLREHKEAINPEILTREPSLERLAYQQQKQGLFHRQAPYAAKALLFGIASAAGTGMLVPCALNGFSYQACQEPAQLSLLTAFTLGCLSYAGYSLRTMIMAKPPKKNNDVLALITSLKEEITDLDGYPRRIISITVTDDLGNTDQIL